MFPSRRAIHDAWWRIATQPHPRSVSDALACGALGMGAAGYGAVVSWRNAAYDRGWRRPTALPARVVSVGNLTVGGTGKTTCVELIARKCLRLERRVAVLSRGYGGTRRPYWLRQTAGRLMLDGQPCGQPDGLADEPRVLASALEEVPIVVGPERGRSGVIACRQLGCDLLILDDGFQHRRVRRDCDIVLVHARMPFGGWPLLPRGPMREPLAALKRAHVVIITKADEALETLNALQERLQSVNREATCATAVHEPFELLEAVSGERRDVQQLEGLRVGLVSSIGDPEGFEATVRRLHATVAWHQAFPDHHPYDAEDARAIAAHAQRTQPDAVLTTTKDWMRLQPWTVDRGPWTVPLWVLKVRMKILSGEAELDARLARVCAG